MNLIVSKNNILRIKVIFLGLILVTSLVPPLMFLQNYHLWILIICIWTLFTGFKKEITQVTIADFGFFCLFIYLGVHFFMNPGFNTYKSTRFLELLGYGLCYANLKQLFFNLKRNNAVYEIFIFILLICFIEGVWGLLQCFNVLKSTNPYFKLTGSLNSPNYLGVFLALGSVICSWFLIYRRHAKWKKAFLGVLGSFFLVLIILSTSRTALLILVMSLVLFTVHKFKPLIKRFSTKRILLLSSVFSISLVFAFYFLYNYKKDSADGRFLINKITGVEILKEPLLGYGLFSFEKGYNAAKADYFTNQQREWNEVRLGNYVYNAFNDYLYITYEIGMLGLLLILICFGYSIFFTKNDEIAILGKMLLLSLFLGAFFMSLSTKSIFVLIGFIAMSFLNNSSNFFFKMNATSRLISSVTIRIIAVITLFLLGNSLLQAKKMKSFYELPESSKSKLSEKELKEVFDNYNRGYSKFNHGYYLFQKGKLNKGVQAMEQGYAENKAPKFGKSLAYAYVRSHNYKRAAELFDFNTGNEAFRYEPRMNLLYLYERIFDKKRIDSLARVIIDFPVKKPSQKVDDYKKYCNTLLNRKSLNSNSFKIKGTVSDDLTLYSAVLNRETKYRIYLPKLNLITESLPVIYLADGQQYVRDKSFVETIDGLINNSKIVPVALIFMDSSDYNNSTIDHRQEYYLCNKNYVDFLTNELMPQIEKYYPVSNKRDDHTIYGYSFGGLFAGYAGIVASDYFKNVVMQSPAYHPCPNIYKAYVRIPKKDLKLYMSYGTGKDTEIQDVPMIKILQQKGYDLRVNCIENANHEWQVWMDQTKDIFTYFFTKN